MTDGLENASHYCSSDEAKHKVEHEKEKYGGEFLFLAANIDAVETAGRSGIPPDLVVDYMADREETELVFHSVADTVCAQRMGAPIQTDWSREIARDHKQRSKR